LDDGARELNGHGLLILTQTNKVVCKEEKRLMKSKLSLQLSSGLVSVFTLLLLVESLFLWFV
jgi:hypothetical protein